MELVHEKYKQTEIGLIPNDWKILNLGKSSTLKARIGWQGLTTAEYLKTGECYLITGTDFKNGFIDWDNCVYVEKERYIQDKNIQVKIDDILVTKDGTIGKVAFIDKIIKQTTLNSGVFVIRPINKKYNSRYLYYVLMSEYFIDFLNRLTAGSTISHLYQKDFVHFVMPLPSLKEQDQIATALSNADTWITNLENLLTKKRQIKQGALQELLKPKLDWEVKKLGEVASFLKGKGLPKSHINESGKYKCIHYGELFTKYKELISNIISHTNEKENTISSISNDVLMPTSDVTPNGLATASCIKENGVILGGDVLIIRPNKNILDGIYLSYFVTKNKERVMMMVTGSTVYHLYGSDMNNFIVEFPKIEEQNQIANILTDMDVEIEQLEIKIDKAKKVKQGMMQELLTGKIRLV
jgi:type I restriction enzyme S subunit